MKQLKWKKTEILSSDEIALSRETVKEEEKEFKMAFEKTLKSLENYEEIEEMLS